MIVDSFREFKKQRVLSSTSPSLEYYDHWSEDGFIPIHPVQNLQVLLVTPPKKIATPIKQGRKFKTEIHPAMLEGIGHFCIDRNEDDEKCMLYFDRIMDSGIKTRCIFLAFTYESC